MTSIDFLKRLERTANRMSRREKQLLQVLLDVVILMGAAACAYLLRLGFGHQFNLNQITMIVVAPVIAIPVFVRLGLYRAVLRYLPERALLTIFRAVVLATLVWTAVAFFTGSYGGDGVPRTIPFLYGMLAFVTVSLSRFTAKWLLLHAPAKRNLRRTLIYGAGKTGTQLARALADAEEANVLGFVDDDREMHGRDIGGIRVYSPKQLEGVVTNLGIEEIILSIPAASSSTKLKIAAQLSRLPVTVRALPYRSSGTNTGRFDASSLEKLDISELIGRSMIPPDQSLIESVIRGRRILITGAGGSIGSQLARLVDANGPREVILVDSSEYALFEVSRTLTNAGQCYPVHRQLGSVVNERFVRRLMEQNRIDVVFHAAAYKHVHLVEQNVREGIRNNIFGTEVVARVAFESGVDKFVFISTDKAVNPTSVMGATKRMGELIVRRYADEAEEKGTGQDFLAVRFGNVIGSSGSVIPLFTRQIEAGGPVTVTDRHVTRYFMAISEAVELIVQSAALSRGGETFLLDMGEPISIYELARDMIALSGRRVRDEANPDGDIEIEIIGLRPGEKLHEELWYDTGSTIPTRHPKIMMAKRLTNAHLGIDDILSGLRKGLEEKDETELRSFLLEETARLNRAHLDGRDSRVIPLASAAKLSGR
ncbi:polysaccharide biosynthesis protein [Oricola thermophila]|uniref:Polysaccharide biosynthesis protein n=1 Tax=Oricola thermophila TaxID=2742145 RepID=A0A6N1VDH3_9HYPH|nr:nucleoside-diphosphate sugar epimerase/dehydratase [Oricola thermophila]QKV18768.1 polysaccharide biosynthesis protein [Oricola thermophila]